MVGNFTGGFHTSLNNNSPGALPEQQKGIDLGRKYEVRYDRQGGRGGKPEVERDINTNGYNKEYASKGYHKLDSTGKV